MKIFKHCIIIPVIICILFSADNSAQEANIQRFPLKIILYDSSSQKTDHLYKVGEELYFPATFFETTGLGKMEKEGDIFILKTPVFDRIEINDSYKEVIYKGQSVHFSNNFYIYRDEMLFPYDLLNIIIENIYNYNFCLSLENLTFYLGKADDCVLKVLLSFYQGKAVIDIYFKEKGQYLINRKKNQIELIYFSGSVGAFSWKNKSYPFFSIYSDKSDKNKILISLKNENFAFKESKQAENKLIRIEIDSPLIVLPGQDEKKPEMDQRPLQNIVIDPGHGGEDTGAIGYYNIKEKDITLDIALILKRLIEKYLGMNVIITRDEDKTISLNERVDIANASNGDLFVSIHANWSRYRQAKGFEVFYANTYASDDDSLLISKIENLSLTDADIENKNIADLDYVLWDLAQSEFLEESMEFSSIINDYAVKELNILNRGVKQAPFFVLLGANMPAALVEIGFITNKNEAKIMQTKEYQTKLANVIFVAIREYRNRFNRRRGISDHHYFEIIPGY